MFSNNNNSQTVWIGLSFLAVGLMIGLMFSSGDNVFANLFGGEEEVEEAAVPDVDPDTLDVVDVSVDDDAVLGDPNAPVTIVEFSDFQCPYCSSFYKESLPQIMANYVDTGKVKIVYRDFPLSGHPQANTAAQAAECVRAQGALAKDELYYDFHDWLFENLSSWSGNENAMEVLITAAQDELGVDIRTCLENGEMADEVNADMTAGRSYGVSGTPSFFINGKKLVGAWPYAVFEKVIESEL